MSAPDPLEIIESRLVRALHDRVVLGETDHPAVLSTWVAICGDVPDSTILCELPPILGRLAREEGGEAALAGAGLIPAAGSRPLFWQALAARVASHVRRLDDAARDSGAPSPALMPPQMASARAQVAVLHRQMMTLVDAAFAVEAERERLVAETERLEAELAALSAEIGDAITGVLDNQADAPRALARLAEAVGLDSAASALRRLPRLPFASPLPPPPREARPARMRLSPPPGTPRTPRPLPKPVALPPLALPGTL
ncbi:hypothetical protein [Pararhodospirillum oryzae]|uniref:Uncharacterized protein n=1 Tax=Pararhodospirillum oryzae TaxID=478448 RepID=A0A512HBK1_9PROT|nr:hypothetical protein [Pararhodospirillum oryzae]GEO82823.1 hypothetical protein ROR02_29540 [Pararhodospirillum oryzae]